MNTSPPGPDVSKAPLLIGVTTVLYTLSLTLYATRIYTRVTPTFRLSLDDYFITAAVLFGLLEWILLLISIHYGVGRHNFYVAPPDMANAEKFLFLSQPPYAWALAAAKLSIIWMLIRLRRGHRAWSFCLYFMAAFVVGTMITMNVFQFSMCKPIAALWDHSVRNPQCLSQTAIQTSIYVTAGATILTDFMLSFLPVGFIVHIQRPLRERVALVCVMGLGVIASVSSIVKTTLVKDYGATGDDLMDGVNITIWSILEVQLAVMASCIPTLKGLFENALRRAGLLSTRHATGGYVKSTDNGSHGLSSMGHRSEAASSEGGSAHHHHSRDHKDFDVESDPWPLGPPMHPSPPPAVPHFPGGTGVVAHATSGGAGARRPPPGQDGIRVGQSVSVESTRGSWAGQKPLAR